MMASPSKSFMKIAHKIFGWFWVSHTIHRPLSNVQGKWWANEQQNIKWWDQKEGWRMEIMEKTQKVGDSWGMEVLSGSINSGKKFLHEDISVLLATKQYIPPLERCAWLENISLRSLQGRPGKGMSRAGSQTRERCHPPKRWGGRMWQMREKQEPREGARRQDKCWMGSGQDELQCVLEVTTAWDHKDFQ